jgi:myo-inositol-1(or 4)-monophosphatase
LFYSERGQGAFFRDSRLRVSGRSLIAESIFATGVPFLGIEGHDEFIEELRVIMAKSAGIRRFGAASLDLAFVAAGRYEGYWERNISSWDMAAGLLLVKEAGGIVTDFKGRDRMLETGSVIATNASLDQDFRKLLKTAAKIT